MSSTILKDHSDQLENVSSDLDKLIQLREEYHDATTKLLCKKLSDETTLIKSIEAQVGNIVQRTKNWPRSTMGRSHSESPISVTAIIHCKWCLEKVSVSRSTQTMPSFIHMAKLAIPKSPTSPKPLRGILRKTRSSESIFHRNCTPKDNKEARVVIQSKPRVDKKQPLIELSAMEWNGKNELKEINQKIKTLNERIDKVSGKGALKVQYPDDINPGLKADKQQAKSQMEKRLEQLEDDILYLNDSN